MILNRVKKWILPKEVDFFANLSKQSKETQHLLEALEKHYTKNDSINFGTLHDMIERIKKQHGNNLKELNLSFITPVDREALSRIYTQIYWIVLSVKHLIVEINTYQIYRLDEYEHIFKILVEATTELTYGFEKFQIKKYELVGSHIDEVIHLDNKLIKAYAKVLHRLFEEGAFPKLLMQKEILFQLREISKQIHICANLQEDILFKIS